MAHPEGRELVERAHKLVDPNAKTPTLDAKKIVTDLYADLGITKGRGRKIAGKPKTVEDYVKVAPDAADALRALIEGLS